jgi:two-component system, chemotaxis family, CheB/CheR fusion protein
VRVPVRRRHGSSSRDVTSQKLAEEKIQEAIRRRDEFLAMLSHELRNPLAAVVSTTELLKSDGYHQRPKLVEIVDRQSQQMSRLLDDLLDASRVTQNKIELKKEPVDIRSIVEEACAASYPVMEARGLTFSLSHDAGSLVVDGDASRLQQVCMNLLTNAAKYTPKGGHVWLETSRDAAHAVIRVRDDGTGIAPEMQEAIFELFVQSNRTLERAHGGIGVGLTLARSLVEMHGGTLDNSRVVVVEDNIDAREMLCQLLTRAGFDCQAVGDGLAAIELIQTFHPCAAIIDVGLPGIDGFEVARRLRAIPSLGDIRLIAVTGYGQKADREMGISAGFDAHLVKPIKFEQLAQLLRRIDAVGEVA